MAEAVTDTLLRSGNGLGTAFPLGVIEQKHLIHFLGDRSYMGGRKSV